MEQEPTNKDLANLIDTLAIAMAQGFESVKSEFKAVRSEAAINTLHLQTQINDIQTDARSFRLETRGNFKEVNRKLDDLSDTIMNHDKRIEKLEVITSY